MAHDRPESDVLPEDADQPLEDGSEDEEEERQPLNLSVEIEEKGPCERHVTVTIPREDIDRYLDKAYSELMPAAQVPGFRPGRAPRKLVQVRFRKEVTDQVKGTLLLESVSQVTEDHKLAAISEPDLDPHSIEVPDEGPMIFEFNIEVRPEFDLPQWKGMQLERPTRVFSDADIEDRLKELLEAHSWQSVDDAAQAGDRLQVDIEVSRGGESVNRIEEELVRVYPELSFPDGKIEGFDKLMIGAKAGDKRMAKITLSDEAANETLRGQELDVEISVLAVERQELPELTPEVISELGGFESPEQVREAVKASLERRMRYDQQQHVRRQVTAALMKAADWQLPQDMLRRQASRELQRSVLELRRAGFSDAEIRAHENELRQNSQIETARALKEHFILERLAEDESIEAQQADYDMEIALIAMQLNEPPRRVRARIEKSGALDALRNQIIERKAIEKILEHANFKDVPYELPKPRSWGVEVAAAGGDADSSIPEVKPNKPAQEE